MDIILGHSYLVYSTILQNNIDMENNHHFKFILITQIKFSHLVHVALLICRRAFIGSHIVLNDIKWSYMCPNSLYVSFKDIEDKYVNTDQNYHRL